VTIHRIPRVTAGLGIVLDCTIAHGQQRAFVEEWKGFHLLTNENAFGAAPGRAKLYFVRGKIAGRAEPGAKHGRAAEAYTRWTEYDPDWVGELEGVAPCKYLQGRLMLLGYRSDKWSARRKPVDYEHDFCERGHTPPLVYTSARTLEASKCVVVTGGSMRVTEGGID
jgi:hypothetical protein